jgi:hypothetical protein
MYKGQIQILIVYRIIELRNMFFKNSPEHELANFGMIPGLYV